MNYTTKNEITEKHSSIVPFIVDVSNPSSPGPTAANTIAVLQTQQKTPQISTGTAH